MIDLYTWTTANGRKIHIMLEETGLPYRAHPVNIGKGDQFKPEFLKINPNNKIPAIVDSDGPGGKPYVLFESGAILMYLAEKTGQFWSQDAATKYRVVQWLMFQMGGIGPFFGQANHFERYAPEKIPYAIERYGKEARRLYAVMDQRLGEAAYFAGDYSIADMAIFPWVQTHKDHEVALTEYPNVQRWYEAVMARPAVQRGIQVLIRPKPQRAAE